MKKRRAWQVALATTCTVGAFAATATADLIITNGVFTNPNAEIGAANSVRMDGDVQFGWQTGNCGIPVENVGHTLELNSGNGNMLNYSGQLTGRGNVRFVGRYELDHPTFGQWDVWLTGAQANTLSGSWHHVQGHLHLAKDTGLDAIGRGTFAVGWASGPGAVEWHTDDQLPDSLIVTVTGGATPSQLRLNGFTEAFASLDLGDGAVVDTGTGGMLTLTALTVNGTPVGNGAYDSSQTWLTGTGTVIVGDENQPPSVPANLQASDGTRSDAIVVTWNPVGLITHYELFRHASADSNAAVQVGGSLSTNRYEDASATLGQTYFYWVKAVNAHGSSGFSAPDSGYIAAVPAPLGLTASDGVYTDRVEVAWNAVTEATSYRVYRAISNDIAGAVQQGSDVTGTNYTDSGVVQEQVYFYWVRAFTATEASGFSASDSGYSQAPGGPFFDITGEVVNPNSTIPAGYTARCVADAFFGWQTGTCSINVWNNGFPFGIDSGNGNALNYGGSIWGSGDVYMIGAGQDTYLHEQPIVLSGATPNRYTGVTRVYKGYVHAAKPDGVVSIPGDVVLGGYQRSVLKFGANGQIASTARITTTGDYPCGIEPNGYQVLCGPLEMQADTLVDFRTSTGLVHFAASSNMVWTAGREFHISNWKGDALTPVRFGASSNALTAVQIAQIGFQNPVGYDTGLYRAVLSSAGELHPGEKVLAATPPFDMSPAAQAQRESLYSVQGLSALTGAGTLLEPGTTIAFFGDSITWQNAYITVIHNALDASPHTSGLGVSLLNFGINGGTSLDIRDGEPGVQAPFADILERERPDVVILFIGINDIWWAGTSPADYEQTLQDIIAQAQARGVRRFVLGTPWLQNEYPDGTNANDAMIAAFRDICERVSTSTGVTFCDLRTLGIAYLQNHNYALRLDGTLVYRPYGLLTYDGVHPTGTGNDYLAQWLTDGIARSLRGSGTVIVIR